MRHSGKKRKKRYRKPYVRGQIKERVSIEERPAIVDEKSHIGNWEIDLVMGAKHRGALVTLVELRSCYTLVGKISSKQTDGVAAKPTELLRPHQAQPYQSWERGLNENTNGLIRQYVSKG